METVARFFQAMAAHGPFLLFVLPLVGALLTRSTARFGDDAVLRTALSNVALSIAVACNLLLHFEVEPPVNVAAGDPYRFQMAGEAVFESTDGEQTSNTAARRRGNVTIQAAQPARRSPSLMRIAVGVDGLSVWFVVLIPLVMLPAVLSAVGMRDCAGRLTAVLLLETALIGVFASVDIVFFLICLELSGLLLLFASGRFTLPGQRRDAIAAGLVQLAGSLCLWLAVAGTVIAHQWVTAGEFVENQPLTFSIIRLTGELPPGDGRPGNAWWHSLEPFLFAMYAIGFLLKGTAFPFHRPMCGEGELPPAFIAIPVYAIAPCVGVYGFLRLAVAVCPWSAVHNAEVLSAVLLLGGLNSGLVAATRRGLAEAVKYASVAHIGLAFASAVQLSRAGVTAAVFLLIAHLAGLSLLILAGDSRHTMFARPLPRALAALAFIGVPGSVGFVGLWLSVEGFLSLGMPFSAACVPATLLFSAWGLIRATQPRADDAPAQPVARPATVMPIALILVAFGVAPQFIVDRTAAVAKRISREAVSTSVPPLTESRRRAKAGGGP